MEKLTIGLATFDDFDGLYFTIQSIRINNPDLLDRIEWVIIDNNPTSPHGQCIRDFVKWIQEPVQYLPYTKKQSTTVRNKIFDLSETEYTISIDSHVIFEPNALKRLIDYFDDGLDKGNLLQGPIIYDDCVNYGTHFTSDWESGMWGQWGTDIRGSDADKAPFEIPSQGLGVFACRTDSWLRFNKNFQGFGGEEGYIHEKYRKNGKKAMCLPFLRWMHRFQRPVAPTYPNNLATRFENYVIGFLELELELDDCITHFRKHINSIEIDAILGKYDLVPKKDTPCGCSERKISIESRDNPSTVTTIKSGCCKCKKKRTSE